MYFQTPPACKSGSPSGTGKPANIWIPISSQSLNVSISGPRELETLTLKLRPTTQKSLLKFCVREEVSPFRVVLAAMGIVLSRTLRWVDLVLGTATANRHPRELHNAVSMSVSTLGLRLQVDPGASFTDMANLVSQTIRQAVSHERYPYDALTSDLRSRTGPLAPRNAKERHIAKAGTTILDHSGFGLYDSFFEVVRIPSRPSPCWLNGLG